MRTLNELDFRKWLDTYHVGHNVYDHDNLSDYKHWIDSLRVAFFAGAQIKGDS